MGVEGRGAGTGGFATRAFAAGAELRPLADRSICSCHGMDSRTVGSPVSATAAGDVRGAAARGVRASFEATVRRLPGAPMAVIHSMWRARTTETVRLDFSAQMATSTQPHPHLDGQRTILASITRGSLAIHTRHTDRKPRGRSSRQRNQVPESDRSSNKSSSEAAPPRAPMARSAPEAPAPSRAPALRDARAAPRRNESARRSATETRTSRRPPLGHGATR